MNDQALLDLIATTFASTLSSPSLPDDLQALKKHLFNRSFDEAFPTTLTPSQPEEEAGCERSETNLEAYIVRWVPTRALCYSRIFKTIAGLLPDETLRAVCIGAGCGSESLALQVILKSTCKSLVLAGTDKVELDIIDSCPEWEGLLSRLTTTANSALTEATVNFHPGDVVTQFAQYTDLFKKTNFVTMMFTLNELVTAQGKVAATKFLINLVKTIPRGALILVVDSPTYSVVEVAGKKFPVSFLMDRLPGLEKLWQVESEWFRYEPPKTRFDWRLDKDLRYPIQLENMRYFGILMKKK